MLETKLEQTESDLKQLNDSLQRMREVDNVTLETRKSNVIEEKKQLKRDAKELCNINDRLRSKLKDLTQSYDTLKHEKHTERSQLYDELQKARNSLRELEEDLQKRQRNFEKEKASLEHQVEEQSSLCEEVQCKYNASVEENNLLQAKVGELVKVNELQQTMTAPELQQLRDEVLSLTKENNQLKIEKLEQDSDRKEVKSLTTSLDETKQRNKVLYRSLTIYMQDRIY